MSLKQWERITRQDIQEIQQLVRDNPNDPANATDLLNARIEFRRYDEAVELAKERHMRFARHTRAQLMLGSWYEVKGAGAQADACFAKALELEPNNFVARCAVALGYLEKNRPEETLLLLEKQPAFPVFLYPDAYLTAAKMLQAKSQPALALAVYQRVLKKMPKLAHNRNVRRLVRECEEAAGSTESLLPPIALHQTKSFRVAAVAGLLLALLFFWNFWIK